MRERTDKAIGGPARARAPPGAKEHVAGLFELDHALQLLADLVGQHERVLRGGSSEYSRKQAGQTQRTRPRTGTTRWLKAFMRKLPRICRPQPSTMSACVTTGCAGPSREMARRSADMTAFLMKPPAGPERPPPLS